MMVTNDNKDETLIYWTVCVVNIIILKVIFGLGKLASASCSASWFWPRPRPRPRRFVHGLGLGLGDLSSASASNMSSFNITAAESKPQTDCKFVRVNYLCWTNCSAKCRANPSTEGDNKYFTAYSMLLIADTCNFA